MAIEDQPSQEAQAMISLKLIGTPERIATLKERGPQIIMALTRKMDELMIRLQSKILTESLPSFFKTYSNIASGVRFNPAQIEGSKIVGSVQAGGPRTTKTTKKSGAQVDYAAVQHEGGRAAYFIEPFPPKKALAFMLDGKRIITKRVFHPPLTARPFMRQPLTESEPDIVSGLEQAIRDALA